MRTKLLFGLGLLALLLLLPACTRTSETPTFNDTPVLALRIDPAAGSVTRVEPGSAARSDIAAQVDGAQLVNDLLELDAMSYEFDGDQMILEAVFTNIGSVNLGRPFTFVPNPATENIVGSVEPTVTNEDLGGDGLLTPGEATSTLTFVVTHQGEPFTYLVDAYAMPGAGELLWTREWVTRGWREYSGDCNWETPSGIATYPSGNVTISGQIANHLHATGRSPYTTYRALFLDTYDSAGNQLRSITQTAWYEGDYDDFYDADVSGIVADASGHLYASGHLDWTTFLRKYDSAGNLLWDRAPGVHGRIATDAHGDVYIVNRILAGASGPAGERHWDLVLTKLDTTGDSLWTRQFGSNEHESGEQVATDAFGNVYLAGGTTGDLDGHVNAGSADLFLAKYDRDGNLVWIRQRGTNEGESVHGIATDSVGNIYLTGSTYGDLDGWTNAGRADGFLIKYAPDGTHRWTVVRGSSDHDVVRGVAVDAEDTIYIVGRDHYLSKYDANGEMWWTVSVATGGGQEVTTDTHGAIYVFGVKEVGDGAFLDKYAP